MRPLLILAGAFILVGCGGSPQERRAQQVEAAAETQADAIEAKARGAPPEVRQDAAFDAETTRDAGQLRADAIRDSEGKLANSAQ